MKKKGFTLIELLAVIVILAIIAMIAVPIVLNLIEKSRRNAFKDSVYGIMEAADLFVVSENYNTNDEIEFVCNGTSCSLDDGRQLSFKGDVPISGSIQIKDKNTLAYFIKSNEYCALGTKESLDVNKDCTELDYTGADLELKLVKATTNSIIVSYKATDVESGISSVEVKLNSDVKKFTYDDKPSIVTNGGTGILFDKLENNKDYTVTLTVTNGNKITKTQDLKVSTKEMKNPDLISVNDPTDAQDGYFKTQTIQIDFDTETKPDSARYFVKTTKQGTSNIEVTKKCDTNADTDTPNINSCETIDSITTLEENVWYEISGNLDVKYDSTDKNKDKNLYAMTYDGTNFSGVATYNLSMIDGTKPTLKLGEIISKTDKLSIGYTATDDESGIKTRTCNYGTESGKYTETGVASETNCSITKLKPSTTYYYKICVQDKVGNEEVCHEGNTMTNAFVNPDLQSTISPEKDVDGFVKTQSITAKFNSENMDEPNHYIKSTREGTASDNVKESCGDGENPSSCSSISETKTLSANTWYKVNGDTITVTYDKASTETKDTLTAITYDGTNYSGVATYTLSKIDATKPSFTMDKSKITSTTNSIKIPYTASDTETGVKVSCKYGTTDGNYENSGTSVDNTCTMSGLTAGTNYYYQVCVSDGVGNEVPCQTGNTSTNSITAPSITLTTNTTGTLTGYALKQVAAVTFTNTNITTPTHYIKTTKAGTSSSSVTESCGNGDKPGTCTGITSTTALGANTWYKVSGNTVSVTYDTPSTATGTLSAITYDGTNYSTVANQDISKIEQPATGITLNQTSATIKVDGTVTLTATIQPANATNKNVTWTADSSGVASVSNGKVTGLKVGTATITAKTANNHSVTASIKVEAKGELLYDKVSVGDYVAYDAGVWNETVEKTTYNSFGGYTKGKSKNETVICDNDSISMYKGWRVLKKDAATKKVTIIHAATPECYYHDWTDDSVTNLNTRANEQYKNSYADSAHAMTYDEIKELEALDPHGELLYCQAGYWLATRNTGSLGYLYKANGAGSVSSYYSDLDGFRPVIVLKSDVMTTGRGKDQVGNENAWILA